MRSVLALCLLILTLLPFAWSGAPQPQPPPQAAQTGSSVTATPLGTYLRGTFELMQGDRAVVTLDDGSVIDAETFDDEAPYRPGQRVVVWRTDEAYILDAPLRSAPLLLALGLFVGLAALVGRAKGLRAVAGTVLTLAVLLYVVAPRLAAGRDVVTTMLLAVPGILLFTVYFVHGVNRKTTAALLGTFVAAGVGFALVAGLSRAMHFTGASSVGGYAAQSLFGLDALGLYVVSVVLGAVGALNDVTVTQASVVESLARDHPHLRRRELYRRAMRVGFDHIGSMVNVLVLAYAAGALPNMLLFMRDPNPLWQKVNGEGFASEITTVLVGATCLLLAVPLSTWLATLLLRPARTEGDEGATG